MSWSTIEPARRALIERVLTDKQLNVMRDRLNGHSWRTIADAYGIDEATARGHWQRAVKRIRNHQERKAA